MDIAREYASLDTASWEQPSRLSLVHVLKTPLSYAPPLICSLIRQIIEKMNGQGSGAEVIPFSVAVKAQGNIEDWLCDLLFKMQVYP